MHTPRPTSARHSHARITALTCIPPLAVCEQRDPKGLYARARRGELAQFTGISAVYEEPIDPALAIDTQAMDLHDCCRLILERVRRHP